MVKCSMCGSQDNAMVNCSNDLHYVRCGQCGFEKQILVDELLSESFDKAQKKYYEEDDLSFLPTVHFINKRRASKRIKVLKKYLPTGKLLEIGPGCGEFLVEARSSGYDVEAIEASSRFVNYLNNELNMQLYSGTIEDFDQGDKLYEGIYSSHVIEHVADPLRHLEIARRLLREDGYLFMATPNAECWEHNVANDAWSMYTTAHLQVFSPASIALCLEKAGWEIVDIKTLEFTEDWLRVLISLFCGKNAKAMQAGKNMRQMPFNVASVMLRIVDYALFPLSYLQSTMKKGGDLFVIARRKR